MVKSVANQNVEQQHKALIDGMAVLLFSRIIAKEKNSQRAWYENKIVF